MCVCVCVCVCMGSNESGEVLVVGGGDEWRERRKGRERQ